MVPQNLYFLSLPLEVRCMIYGCTGRPKAVYLDYRFEANSDLRKVAPPFIPGSHGRQTLWNTCHQIRHELTSLEHPEHELTVRIRGIANLADMMKKIPACLQMYRIARIYMSLSGHCHAFQYVEWLTGNGLGMTGEEILERLPDLKSMEMRIDVSDIGLHGELIRNLFETWKPILIQTGQSSGMRGRMRGIELGRPTTFTLMLDRDQMSRPESSSKQSEGEETT